MGINAIQPAKVKTGCALDPARLIAVRCPLQDDSARRTPAGHLVLRHPNDVIQSRQVVPCTRIVLPAHDQPLEQTAMSEIGGMNVAGTRLVRDEVFDADERVQQIDRRQTEIRRELVHALERSSLRHRVAHDRHQQHDDVGALLGSRISNRPERPAQGFHPIGRQLRFHRYRVVADSEPRAFDEIPQEVVPEIDAVVHELPDVIGPLAGKAQIRQHDDIAVRGERRRLRPHHFDHLRQPVTLDAEVQELVPVEFGVWLPRVERVFKERLVVGARR